MKLSFGIIGYGRFGKVLHKILETSEYSDIKIYSPDNKKLNNLDEVLKQEIVFVCVPISEFQKVIQHISPKLTGKQIIIDVCSVKTYPVQVMKKFLNKQIDILATHPMFGPDSSKNGTFFEGLQFVYYPVRISNQSRYNKIIKIFKDLKLKMIELEPKEHDRQTAYTQQFAFLVGKIGISLKVGKNIVTTKGFENGILYNQMAMQNDTPQLFRDMQIYNPFTKAMRAKFIKAAVDIDNELNLQTPELL